MNIFEEAGYTTKQGDIGEAKAIYEFTKRGYNVSRTLFDSCKYDLIIEKDGIVQRVQVKSTQFSPKNRKGFQVQVATTGGNRVVNTITKPEATDYDLLCIVTSDDNMWLIPSEEIAGRINFVVGSTGPNAKFNEYKL